MKKKGVMVFLAVVLVMTLFLGTFGYAHAAKPYIEINEGSFELRVDASGNFYKLYGTATLHDKRVAYYAVEWFSDISGSMASLGVWEYELSTPTKTGTIVISTTECLGPSFCGHDFYCKVYITNRNFKLNDHRSYTSGEVTLTCD
jgi:hypothetical protein